jgi:hypothetical protein
MGLRYPITVAQRPGARRLSRCVHGSYEPVAEYYCRASGVCGLSSESASAAPAFRQVGKIGNLAKPEIARSAIGSMMVSLAKSEHEATIATRCKCERLARVMGC